MQKLKENYNKNQKRINAALEYFDKVGDADKVSNHNKAIFMQLCSDNQSILDQLPESTSNEILYGFNL